MSTNQHLIERSLASLRQARTNLAAAGENVVKRNDALVSSMLRALGSVPAFAAHATEIARRTASADAAVEAAVQDGTYAISRRLNRLKAATGAASVPDPAWAPVAATVRERSGSLESPAGPGPDATIEEISDWWARVDDDYRNLMIRDHADDLRHIDGIPIPVRNDLNQRQLKVDIADLHSQLAKVQDDIERRKLQLVALSAAPGVGLPGLPSPNRELKKLRKREAELTADLGGLEAIQAEIDKAAAEGREVFLIDYSREDNGTLAFAYNNPDTADRVATYFAGGGTSLARAAGPLEDFSNVLEMVERLDAGTEPPPTTCGIVRIYNIRKPVPLHIMLPVVPKANAPAAVRLQQGLVVTRAAANPDGNDPRRIVIGHSLGNSVIGEASKTGVAADAWAINSVGGVRLRTAGDADIAEVDAGLADNDPLNVISWSSFPQGRQPAKNKKFDAVEYAVGAGQSGYLPGGTSMRAHFDVMQDPLAQLNNAEIIRGNPPIHTEPLKPAA